MAVNEWIEVEDQRELEKEKARLPKEQAVKEAHEAEMHRLNLFRSAHWKHYLSSSSGSGTEEGRVDGLEDSDSMGRDRQKGTVRKLKSMRKKGQEIIEQEDTQEMVAAVKGMGDAVKLVAERLGGSESEDTACISDMGNRLDLLEKRLFEESQIHRAEAVRVEEQQEKTNQLLEGILNRLKAKES